MHTASAGLARHNGRTIIIKEQDIKWSLEVDKLEVCDKIINSGLTESNAYIQGGPREKAEMGNQKLIACDFVYLSSLSFNGTFPGISVVMSDMESCSATRSSANIPCSSVGCCGKGQCTEEDGCKTDPHFFLDVELSSSNLNEVVVADGTVSNAESCSRCSTVGLGSPVKEYTHYSWNDGLKKCVFLKSSNQGRAVKGSLSGVCGKV